MEEKTISIKESKKRKMLLVLPILALPFVTIIFWTLGGGKMNIIAATEVKKGFNIELPNPKFKQDSTLDKMSYYDQAVVDSLKFEEQIKKDPNYTRNLFEHDSVEMWNEKVSESDYLRKGKIALNTTSYKNHNEQMVYQKLSALQKAIREPAIQTDNNQDMTEFENFGSSDVKSTEVKNLESMMSSMNSPQEPDPELKQLGGMLENILDIQHPDRVQQKLKILSENQKGQVFNVDRKIAEENITTLYSGAKNKQSGLGISEKQNGFYSSDEEVLSETTQNAIEAVIHETQTIVNGSTVKLRLNNEVFINGVLIPRNSFIYGMAALKGERLEVKIENIKYGNSIFPVSLSVYDLDGIIGVYIPGTINREVAKASADRSIQNLGVAGLDDSWGAQAAGMGVEAAKSLLSKKVKLIKVVVKAGYQVLLYDEKQKNLK